MSKVAQREEKLPYVVGLMAPPGKILCRAPYEILTKEPGSDLVLMDMVYACLQGAGRPTCVRTGSTMFKDTHRTTRR